jgi:hypothetical protein
VIRVIMLRDPCKRVTISCPSKASLELPRRKITSVAIDFAKAAWMGLSRTNPKRASSLVRFCLRRLGLRELVKFLDI